MTEQDDDGIPLLNDIVRAGRAPNGTTEGEQTRLTEAEIEAIAARVVERHTQEIEEAVARAIHKALDAKQAGRDNGHEA
ncbi:MAG: hypothetical protein WD382_05355 [Halofilum sp. (in: g-proteobacteria)]